MKITHALLTLPIAGIVSSCFLFQKAPPPLPPVEEHVINYDFTPPTTNTERVDISFILLNPKFAESMKELEQPMFKNFIKNMGLDFEEMLIAKGYSIRGPYDTYDEMVYADKVETDLLLDAEISFTYEWGTDAKHYKRFVGYRGATTGYDYWIDGNLHLAGKVNLVIKEALTQEKLWVKSISLASQQVYIQTEHHRVSNHHTGAVALANDTRYKNAIYETLDVYYQKALKTAWNHLEPEELKVLKKQVKELRKKKGY